MTTATESATHQEQTVDLAGLKLRILQDGTGNPAVVLHHSTGNPGWIPFHEELAKSFAVTVPDLPGYGQSERPAWAREPRDLGILANQAIVKFGLENVTLIGSGMGGFIAAEMAAMSRDRLSKLVLIGAAGIQPEQGEIYDQMLVDFHDYVKAGFATEQGYNDVFGENGASEMKQLWDFSREMTARLTWKPYMFNRRLAPLLSEVDTETLLIWGSEDMIVPRECGEAYKTALPNAKLEVIDGGGHLVEYEQPEKIATMISSFANS